MDSMKGKVVIVTGANTGIGRATAEELARRGAQVVMVCRSRERGEEARKAIAAVAGAAPELVVADLASLKQTRTAAAEILAKHPRIDVLVNNAAVFLPNRETTEDGLEKTFVTNYLSHFLLTSLLLPALKAAAPSRIVNVATLPSGIKVDLDDLQLEKTKYSFMKAVGASKMSQLLFTRELAKRLEGTGVTVNALHPGLTKTPLLDELPWMLRKLFHLMSASAAKGARTPIWLASAPEVARTSGKLFAACKEKPWSGQATDDAAQKALWAKSAALAGLPG